MSEQDGQLAVDYRDLQQRFAASPHIRVRAVQGDPPEIYEIEYILKGLHKDGDGPMVAAEVHTVRIELPYGYPMFSPKCRPVSPIFHPDFTATDICTAAFWDKTPSLPHLIIHIGELIAYQSYSDSEPHNPAALAWAQSHGELLPLDQTDLSDLAPSHPYHEENPEPDLVADIQQEAPPRQDLASAPAEAVFDQLDQPIDDLQDFELPTAGAAGLSQTMRFIVITGVTVVLCLLAGGFYLRSLWHYEGAVHQWISVMPLLDQERFPEADEQLQLILARLDKVRLVNKAEKLHLLERINQVRSTERYRQGLLGNEFFNGHYYSPQELESFHDISRRLAKAETFGSLGKWREALQEYESASHANIFLNERAPVAQEVMRKRLNIARLQEILSGGDQLMAEKQWSAAEAQFQRALHLLADIRTDLGSFEAQDVEEGIREKIESLQEFTGRDAYAEAVAEGDGFFSEKQWSQAVSRYESALRIAERTGGELGMRAEKIKEHRDIALFNAAHADGAAAMKNGKWDAAIEQLETAAKLRSKITASGAEVAVDQHEIAKDILTARIRREETAAASFITDKKYAQANTALTALVALIDGSAMATEREFALARKAATERIADNTLRLEIGTQQTYLESSHEKIFFHYFPSAASSDLSDLEISFVQHDDTFLYYFMRCKSTKNRLQTILELDYRYNRKTGKWSTR